MPLVPGCAKEISAAIREYSGTPCLTQEPKTNQYGTEQHLFLYKVCFYTTIGKILCFYRYYYLHFNVNIIQFIFRIPVNNISL